MEHIVNNPENQWRPSTRKTVDPGRRQVGGDQTAVEGKASWPEELKDLWTGRGQFTGLTPEELKAKCENYGTLLPWGQRRR